MDTQMKAWMESPLPDKLPDDDDGFDQVKLYPNNTVVLSKVTAAEVRAVYEGKVDMYGNANDSMKLDGGTNDGQMYAVDLANRGIEHANKMVQVMSAGEFQLLIVDVLRLSARQRGGFKKTAGQMMAADGIVMPTPEDVMKYGKQATRIFSYVRPQQNETHTSLVERLQKDAKLMAALRGTVELAKGDPALPAAMEKALSEYIAMTANLDMGDASEAGLDLTATHADHGGGATVDFFIADRHGKPISVVPFDYPDAKIAAYRFTEDDANYDVLIAQIKATPMLAEHFKQLGYAKAEDFKRSDWEYYKQANRVQVQMMMAMGATTWMDERWHFPFGNEITTLDGSEPMRDSTAAAFPNSGGTGITAIKQGKNGTAVWNTASSERYLRKIGQI